MTNGSDRLDRIEQILDRLAARDVEFDRRHEEFDRRHEESTARVDKHLEYMAARQQYHDEASERFDIKMRRIEDAQEKDGEHIRALVRVAELHHRRLEGLEGSDHA